MPIVKRCLTRKEMVPVRYSYNKLRGRIIEKYKTQERFAKSLGISKNSLSLKMNGKTSFSQEDVKKWCGMLDIKTEEIGEYFFA